MLYYIMLLKQYSLTLNEKMIDLVDEYAKKEKRSRSFIVNECIELRFKKR